MDLLIGYKRQSLSRLSTRPLSDAVILGTQGDVRPQHNLVLRNCEILFFTGYVRPYCQMGSQQSTALRARSKIFR
jgi:hypothetical protein